MKKRLKVGESKGTELLTAIKKSTCSSRTSNRKLVQRDREEKEKTDVITDRECSSTQQFTLASSAPIAQMRTILYNGMDVYGSTVQYANLISMQQCFTSDNTMGFLEVKCCAIKLYLTSTTIRFQQLLETIDSNSTSRSRSN